MASKLTYEAIVEASQPAPRGWWHRLSEADQKSLIEVRKQWQAAVDAGTAPPAFTFARGLLEACKGTTIRLPAKKAISEWLKQKT